MESLEKKFRRKHLVLIVVNALLVAAFVACLALSASLGNSLRSQQAAEVWAGQSGERFAQVSVFFPESYGFDERRIFELRDRLNRALLEVSLESGPGNTLIADAWSADYNFFVVGEHDSLMVPVIGVGGDFFLFHPLNLRSGSYISPNDIMKDRVVLDEELAWRLFGSSQLAGLEVTINDRPFIIAGVVSRESDFASGQAYTGGAGMFMSFEAVQSMTDGDIGVSSYAVVMPNPITGFALSALTETFPDSDVHIVENSARFSIGNAFRAIRSFGERSMRTDAIALPYWENAARIVEDWLALLLLLALVFAVLPFVCAVIYCVVLVRFGFRFCKRKVIEQIHRRDDRKYKEYLAEHSNEPQIYDTAYNVTDVMHEGQDER